MLGSTFYHQTIRKYVAVFGTLFNDINIERKNSSDVIVERIKVPLAYGPKQKWLLAVQDTTADRKVAATRTPRMGFAMTGVSYDSARKLNTIGRNVKANTSSTTTSMVTMYNPVPYNFDFQLFILVKNAEDGTQILEQILPYFTPEFTVTVNTIPDMNIKADVPITLNSADVADEYEGDLSARRTITWTLSFTLKGFIYPNVTSGQIIKSIEVNFRIPGGDTEIETAEFIIFEDSTPDTTNYIILDGYNEGTSYTTFSRARIVNENTTDGVQDATIKSRVTIAPSPLSATANSDYGFSETFEFFDEGKYNDPTTGTDIAT
jgi:hypothetical protein|tara:strand:- start:215 stop:1174 length:960 start_codon:yes stop_codon:yes gene_type:complete